MSHNAGRGETIQPQLSQLPQEKKRNAVILSAAGAKDLLTVEIPGHLTEKQILRYARVPRSAQDDSRAELFRKRE